MLTLSRGGPSSTLTAKECCIQPQARAASIGKHSNMAKFVQVVKLATAGLAWRHSLLMNKEFVSASIA